MKQSEIEIGHSYIFKCTDSLHKKDMIGTIVTIVSKTENNSNNKEYFKNRRYKKPIRFKLSNGRYANAGELTNIK